jgi:hypothetical protein
MDDPSASLAPAPWPPARAEMAIWNPADSVRDAGREFEQLAQRDMGVLRRVASVALLLMLVATGLNWIA